MKYIELTEIRTTGVEAGKKCKILVNFDKVHSLFPSNNNTKLEMKRGWIVVEESYEDIYGKLL